MGKGSFGVSGPAPSELKAWNLFTHYAVFRIGSHCGDNAREDARGVSLPWRANQFARRALGLPGRVRKVADMDSLRCIDKCTVMLFVPEAWVSRQGSTRGAKQSSH